MTEYLMTINTYDECIHGKKLFLKIKEIICTILVKQKKRKNYAEFTNFQQNELHQF